jgi:FdhD protein
MPVYKVVNGVKIAVDALIKIVINDRLAAEVVANPEDLEDLGIGYAYSEGFISDLGDVAEVRVAGDEVRLWIKRSVDGPVRRLEDCGMGHLLKAVRGGGGAVDVEYMKRLAGDFTKLTIWHVDPHLAMHTSALYLDGEWLVVHDTSRHSGVIKLIGKYLRRGGAGVRIAFTTGRVSSDMVYRLATIGVDGIVSLRGPLYSGLEAACRLGIPLVSNVRNTGFTRLC